VVDLEESVLDEQIIARSFHEGFHIVVLFDAPYRQNVKTGFKQISAAKTKVVFSISSQRKKRKRL
jgi:predicted RNA-binding protein with PIN domain